MSSSLLKVGMLLSILPDLDVIAFRLGIPYASQWGHRGFTHSISTALLMALFCTLFYKKLNSNKLSVFIFSFISMVSHPLLDALTDGGLGVALLWPFSFERFFLPWRIISVSPIGSSFFSVRGLLVIQSEFVTVCLPAIIFGLCIYFVRDTYFKKHV
ncbi:metal-dependent hydrolase [Iodobacter arcticus]|uniref:Metal-dependent hydrolase n=1 Tax=Iodobacter arcticus TaxID=590593 RepID=A0ABW2R433_9NEIS